MLDERVSTAAQNNLSIKQYRAHIAGFQPTSQGEVTFATRHNIKDANFVQG